MNMKKSFTILAVILFLVTGCGGEKQGDLITVDVTKSYSSKKAITLQDFMDVEYIALETNDDFVNQGFVQDIGKEIILVRNRNDDGNIYVYDRTGKALRKINRKGQGGEEYSDFLGITLDEDNKEMFVNDHFTKKIMVYDLEGNFKRSLSHKEENGALFYTDIFNYDKDNLICYDEFHEKISFIIISKQDGSVTKEIKIPFKEKKLLVQRLKNETDDTVFSVSPGPHRSIIPHNGEWLLLEFSSDTVYNLLPDYSLQPFLVRTPSIQSMDPEVMLVMRLSSDRYYFMETVKNQYDFQTERGFTTNYFVYDKDEKSFYGYIVYNGDYSTKSEMYMSMARPISHEIESWYPLQSHRLVRSYERGELKGKLKEVAATLDEESNPVIMLIKHKR